MRTVRRSVALPATLLAAAALTACSQDSGTSLTDLGSVVISAHEGFTATGGEEFDVDPSIANSAEDRADRQRRTDAGVTRGFARSFVDQDGTTRVSILVYEAKSPSAARALHKATVKDSERDHGATEFEVRGIKGAVGQTYIGGEQPITIHVVSFPRDRRLYLVSAAREALGAPTGTVLEMARAQAAIAK